MTTRYSFQRAGHGPNYKWSNDHSFVKVSGDDTGGQYCLIEDNLSAEFTLGLHLHRHHAETFYVLDGAIPFHVDGDWMIVGKGDTLHVPPGVPHAVDRPEGGPAKMLMIMQPSGFDGYLAELAKLSDDEFADETFMTALAERFDIFELGGVPERRSE